MGTLALFLGCPASLHEDVGVPADLELNGARPVLQLQKSKSHPQRRSLSLFPLGHTAPRRWVRFWPLHVRRDAGNLECILKQAARMARGLERNETCQERLQVFNQVWLI